MRSARQIFLGRGAGAPTPPLPYDAEVEYVETDGLGAYINTGIITDGASRVCISFAVQNIAYAGSGTTYNNVFGAVAPNAGALFCNFGLNVSYNNNQFRFNNPNMSDASDSPAYDNNKHDVIIARPDNGGILFDGVAISTSSTYNTSYVDAFCIGAGRDVSSSTVANKGRFFTGTRFYSCQINSGGVLVFDGIPVRKDGQGYLYDRVSGDLFGNAGATGTTVTYGPDKS